MSVAKSDPSHHCASSASWTKGSAALPLFHEKSLKITSLLYGIAHAVKDTSYPGARSILLRSKQLDLDREFDIFLSHSYSDANVILGLKIEVERMGYSVYVDWVEDEQLERSDVNKHTADLLRKRMRQCRCLFFVTSTGSGFSKWMPWECGYFDGIKGRVAMCPISEQPGVDEFKGQEYLDLYPYVTKDRPRNREHYTLWINESPNTYVVFDRWLEGELPCKH
jgi:hypothetical protein